MTCAFFLNRILNNIGSDEDVRNDIGCSTSSSLHETKVAKKKLLGIWNLEQAQLTK